jgi:hypothetical protein
MLTATLLALTFCTASLTCYEIRLYEEAVANANRNVNKDNGMKMFDYQEQYRHEMDAADEKWKQCVGWQQGK